MRELIIESVKNLKRKKVLNLVKQALEIGENPLVILESVQQGMIKVGKLYETQDYYIADLIMAGIIFKEVLKIVEIESKSIENISDIKGKILLGTVSDDLHDIGKDIFVGMAKTAGFKVLDLGVDVPAEVFVNKTIEFKPDIIGMSGVLSLAVKSMKRTIDALENAGLRKNVKIIVGGQPLSKEICKLIGADDYTLDAQEGIEICQKWMENK